MGNKRKRSSGAASTPRKPAANSPHKSSPGRKGRGRPRSKRDNIQLPDGVDRPKDEHELMLEQALFGGTFASDPPSKARAVGVGALDMGEGKGRGDGEGGSNEWGGEGLFVVDKVGEGPHEGDEGEEGEEGDERGEESEEEGEGKGAEQQQDEQDEEEQPAAGDADGAAWQDSDDEGVQIDISRVKRARKLRDTHQETVLGGAQYAERLRRQHALLNTANVKWANKLQGQSRTMQDAHSDSDDEGGDASVQQILRSTSRVVQGSESLPRTILNIQRVTDGNTHGVCKATVSACPFHPSEPLLMTAAADHCIRLFRIDGKQNSLVHTTFLQSLPITHARFIKGGSHVVASGGRRFFFVLDLVSGTNVRVNPFLDRSETGYTGMADAPSGEIAFLAKRSSNIVVTHPDTFRHLFELKPSARVNDMVFLPDGNRLLTVGQNGLVHVFDLRMRRCERVWKDAGSLETTSVDCRAGLLVTGDRIGVMNVYDLNDIENETPQPVRAVMNLTTRVTSTAIHPSGEMLGYASHVKKALVRMVHAPSFHVFKNWPLPNVPLGYVSALSFSPHGGYLAAGNDKGRVLLFRLKHFQNC